MNISFSETSFIHPQSPPIPALHPSLEVDNQDPRRSRTASGSSFIQKATDSKSPGKLRKSAIPVIKNPSAKTRKQACGFDQGKILDPRSRAKLDMEPKVRLVNSTALPLNSIVLNNNIPSSEPIHHSSLGIQRQINHVKNSEFDPVHEISRYMLQCQEGVKNVHNKVTAKVYFISI
jgi:hypothetical protein